jgi:hypothetical protein
MREPPPLGLVCHKQHPAVNDGTFSHRPYATRNPFKNQGPDFGACVLIFARRVLALVLHRDREKNEKANRQRQKVSGWIASFLIGFPCFKPC